jgi:hypothetical protein
MDNIEKMMQQILEKMAADKEDFLARMKEDRKTEQENMAAKQEDLLARMDKMDAKMAKADKQEEMLTEIKAKMDATIQSIRYVVQETNHQKVEYVGADINQKTEANTEKIHQGMMQSAYMSHWRNTPQYHSRK